MSPDTDAYWVGALAMVCAHAQWLIALGEEEKARLSLVAVLQRLSESPVFDDGFKDELALYWEPREEIA